MALVLAFMPSYSIFNLQLFLSILLNNFFNLVLKHQIETINGTSISYLYLPCFTRAIPKRRTFGLCLCVLSLYNVHVLYCIQLVWDLNVWKALRWPCVVVFSNPYVSLLPGVWWAPVGCGLERECRHVDVAVLQCLLPAVLPLLLSGQLWQESWSNGRFCQVSSQIKACKRLRRKIWRFF